LGLIAKERSDEVSLDSYRFAAKGSKLPFVKDACLKTLHDSRPTFGEQFSESEVGCRKRAA